MAILERQAELRDTKHEAGLQFRCGRCGAVKDVGISCGTGYGYEAEGPDEKPICYACCGEIDRERMNQEGRAILYLTIPRGLPNEHQAKVSNWPGSLSFPCYVKIGRHNRAGKRYDVWFKGPDGKEWHGVTYGDNTQICRCKRTKG